MQPPSRGSKLRNSLKRAAVQMLVVIDELEEHIVDLVRILLLYPVATVWEYRDKVTLLACLVHEFLNICLAAVETQY